MNLTTISVTLIVSFHFLLAAPAICFAQSTEQTDKLVSILKPYVVSLERDAWTFRYEREGAFQPTNVQDLAQHLSRWASQFTDIENRRGADTGPGVYVSTDPVATSTWGGVHPQLFALKLKQGTRVLIGDQWETPPAVLESLNELARQMNCGTSSTHLPEGLGHAVGYFRNNQNIDCRKVLVQAIQILKIDAISFGFNSVGLKDCRVTGTALSIINPNVISLGEINRYTGHGAIEGQPAVTPFIQQLFKEAKTDFYAQTLLADTETWERFKKGYGFFSQVESRESTEYLAWKATHILKCGAEWSVETSISIPSGIVEARKHPHPEVSELLVRISLVYRDRYYQSSLRLPHGIPSEFRAERLRAVLARENGTPAMPNLIRYNFAQVPVWTGDAGRDEADYLSMLKKCLSRYANPADDFGEIVAGECGVIPE